MSQQPVEPAPSAFPTELPPRPQGGGGGSGRHRVWWPYSWSEWTLRTHGDKAKLLRRLCMWSTILLRLGTSAIAFIIATYGGIGGFVIGVILSLAGLFFVTFCLAGIGEATGTRRVMGICFTRRHFDIFLLFCVAIHVFLFLIMLLVPGGRYSFIVIWYLMWILIVVAYWITIQAPEPSGYV
ncbi:hypothetical protein BX600DRAFT_431533 [Xylariales sp. PMI_506]|nr:hypothetical protein BX600DRAFT_431533 [Xylariales sp. PMI_506]